MRSCSGSSAHAGNEYNRTLLACPAAGQRIPLLGQEGWPRHQTLEGAAGVVILADHPVCAFKGASRYFLDAQPPLLSEEGNTFRNSATSSSRAVRPFR